MWPRFRAAPYWAVSPGTGVFDPGQASHGRNRSREYRARASGVATYRKPSVLNEGDGQAIRLIRVAKPVHSFRTVCSFVTHRVVAH